MRKRYAIVLAVLSAASHRKTQFESCTRKAHRLRTSSLRSMCLIRMRTRRSSSPRSEVDYGRRGKFLARGGKTISFEGAAPAPRVVIIEFASLDKANTWRNASAHTSAMEIGKKHATFRSFAVEGLGTR